MTVVLKGANTIVSRGSRGSVNSSGNPYMATAGSGDVLSGVIAALISQGLPLKSAAELAVYIHGAAGDRVFRTLRAPFLASDLIAALPYVLAPCIE